MIRLHCRGNMLCIECKKVCLFTTSDWHPNKAGWWCGLPLIHNYQHTDSTGTTNGTVHIRQVLDTNCTTDKTIANLYHNPEQFIMKTTRPYSTAHELACEMYLASPVVRNTFWMDLRMSCKNAKIQTEDKRRNKNHKFGVKKTVAMSLTV